ncbi:unnamed protein product, partial [Didymodactylos carnosus]
LMLDKGFGKEISLVLIICIKKADGCEWSGNFKDYQAHLDTHRKNNQCEYCKAILPSKYLLAEHQIYSCRDVAQLCSLAKHGCQEKQTYETLTALTADIQTLSEDSIRLNIELLSHKNVLGLFHNGTNQLKQSIVEIDSYSRGISWNQEMLQQEISSVKQNVEDLQSISYDGTLTWKISNVSEKMADAESERQTSIYSPHFYSSPTGYKMCIRLYLHGDDNARHTHMSLLFLLMRGKFDAILRWPFNFKVTFCLFDQSGQQKHIIDSFRPDIKSNSFQRPKSEINIASGIPKFFPLPMILQDNNGYIRDDTMYIKCLIDFGDISKIILPYALSLNPALPHHVQRNIIQIDFDKSTHPWLQLQQQQQLIPATTSDSSNTFQLFNNGKTARQSADIEKNQSTPFENICLKISSPNAVVFSLHSSHPTTQPTVATTISDSSDSDEFCTEWGD